MFKDLDSWEYENKAISKTFEFSSYLSGVNFLNKIASLAEELDHHPDITLTWCKVRILLTTHDKGDVTEKDIELAKLCDKYCKE
jgi:4a-hydroxytetrahydrobiopterin dehydratase